MSTTINPRPNSYVTGKHGLFPPIGARIDYTLPITNGLYTYFHPNLESCYSSASTAGTDGYSPNGFSQYRDIVNHRINYINRTVVSRNGGIDCGTSGQYLGNFTLSPQGNANYLSDPLNLGSNSTNPAVSVYTVQYIGTNAPANLNYRGFAGTLCNGGSGTTGWGAYNNGNVYFYAQVASSSSSINTGFSLGSYGLYSTGQSLDINTRVGFYCNGSSANLVKASGRIFYYPATQYINSFSYVNSQGYYNANPYLNPDAIVYLAMTWTRYVQNYEYEQLDKDPFCMLWWQGKNTRKFFLATTPTPVVNQFISATKATITLTTIRPLAYAQTPWKVIKNATVQL